MAISVGSVEVDVVPNVRGIYGRLQAGLLPAANRIGEDLGRAIGRNLSTHVASAVRSGVTQGGQTARVTAARQGSDTGGAFGRMFRTRVTAAMQNLPRVDVRLSDTGFNADLARVRARMEALGNRRVGVDIDAATALSQIDRLERDLERLGASHPDVNVRVDTGQARSELATLRAEIARLDGQDIDVRVDTSAAVSSLGTLTTAAVAFGPALLPVLPVAAAGLGALGAAALSAGAGVGALAAVAAPAFAGISSALQAQKQAQDAATNASLRGGQAASQAASRALQLAGAQQALAAAERNGARQIAQAQQQVVQARQNAVQVAAQAAQRSQQAARAVQDAERSLADAQRDARRAQEDLNAARRTAAEQLQDLKDRLSGAALDERAAVLRVKEAEQELAAVQAAGSKATQLQREQAQLAYDQAVQGLREQQRENARLKSEVTEASRAGVDGSEVVRAAQERLADSQRQVADRARAVKDAQAEAARVQRQNAADIAAAQQRIADAQANVADVQQRSADAIASAQRQIAQASQQAAGGVDQAAVAQAKYQAELAKLTPSARATFTAFTGLRSAFGDWSRSLQPAVMPIFTRALNGMRKALPSLTPFVLAAAEAIGELQDKVSAGFKSPWWKSFKEDLAGSVKPAITGLGTAMLNVGKGVAGVIQAFLPHMDSISARAQEVTGRFAAWGTSLKGSPGFERFLAYVSEQAPLLASTVGNLLGALLRVGVALAPMAGTAVAFLDAIAAGIRAIPVPVLTTLGVTFASIAIGAKLAAAAMALWRGATAAAAIATKILTGQQLALNAAQRASLIGIIVTAIMALVVAVIYAWKNFKWFREAVMTAWRGIQTAALWAWNTVLKPVFEWIGKIVVWLWNSIIKPYIGFIVAYWRMVARVAMWLWRSVLSPTFKAIGAVIAWWWNNIVKRYFGMVRFAVQTLAAVFRWLYDKAARPVIRAIAAVFRWLYDKAVKPVFGWIRDRISTVWTYGIKPTFEALKRGVRAIRDAFEDAKDGIRTAWDKIKDAAKKPINWVLRVVWNDGIVGVWGKIRDWIPGLPKLEKLPLLAAGGPMPVRPGVFNRPTAIVGEGNPRHPEYVIPTDPKYRKRALALHAAAGSQLLAEGGILGKVGDVIGDVVGSATDFLADPVKSLGKLLDPLLGKLKHVTGSPWGKMAAGLPRMAFKGIRDLVRDKVEGLFGGDGGGGGRIPGGSGVKRWTGVVQQALRLVGQPLSYTGITLRRMNQESGGNPRAVNLWDINAVLGHPSVGLMQVIRPTFNAHAGRFRNRGPKMYGVSIDPLANIYASMRYALSRYGSLPRAYNRPGGYDSGGLLMPGQLGYNGLSQPEAVLTPRQWNSISTLAARGAGATGLQPGQPVVLQLEDGPLVRGYVKGIADESVDAGFTRARRVFEAGRRF